MKHKPALQPTPEQTVTSCVSAVSALLARRGCTVYGDVQIIRASRLRLWLLRWLSAGRVEVVIKIRMKDEGGRMKEVAK